MEGYGNVEEMMMRFSLNHVAYEEEEEEEEEEDHDDDHDSERDSDGDYDSNGTGGGNQNDSDGDYDSNGTGGGDGGDQNDSDGDYDSNGTGGGGGGADQNDSDGDYDSNGTGGGGGGGGDGGDDGDDDGDADGNDSGDDDKGDGNDSGDDDKGDGGGDGGGGDRHNATGDDGGGAGDNGSDDDSLHLIFNRISDEDATESSSDSVEMMGDEEEFAQAFAGEGEDSGIPLHAVRPEAHVTARDKMIRRLRHSWCLRKAGGHPWVDLHYEGALRRLETAVRRLMRRLRIYTLCVPKDNHIEFQTQLQEPGIILLPFDFDDFLRRSLTRIAVIENEDPPFQL